MNIHAAIELYAYGTSEGVSKEWDTRGRGRKTKIKNLSKQHKEVLKIIPKSHLKGLDSITGVGRNFSDIVTKLLGKIPFGESADGMYHFDEENGIKPMVLIRRGVDKSSFAHEIGHHVWERLLTEKDRKSYANTPPEKSGNFKKYDTIIKNPIEKFAEGYQRLITGDISMDRAWGKPDAAVRGVLFLRNFLMKRGIDVPDTSHYRDKYLKRAV